MATIKQIVIFQLKALRMASFLEFVLQVLNIVKSYRDFGEAALRSENPKTFGFSLFFRTFGFAEGTRVLASRW